MGLTEKQQLEELNYMISMWSRWMTDWLLSAELYQNKNRPHKLEIYAKCIERASQRIIKLLNNGSN